MSSHLTTLFFFFFNDTATTEIYTLSLHDALPISAYLEVLSDALTSCGVLLAAATVTFTGWTTIDPLVSAAIALFIVPRTWRLLRQAVNILLEGTPAHLELARVEAAMLEVARVLRVHGPRVWTLTSGREAMSAHVVLADPADSERLPADPHA